MFNKNFYPTPDNIIRKMLENVDIKDKKILDPSAGKGNILDFIKEEIKLRYYHYRDDYYEKLYCIEIELELQMILTGKGYKLLDSNFLLYVPEYNFDLIIMNPPFDNGIKHFLKAYEISNGAEIVCLLNKTNVDNISNTERELLQDILKKENVKPINLGDCFIDSERKTNVEVVMIKIPKRQVKSNFKFEFTGESKETEKLYTVEDLKNNQLESIDVYESMVHRYNKTREIASKIYTLKNELSFYAKGVTDSNIVKLCDENIFLEGFSDSFRISCWNKIFIETKLKNLVTYDVKNQILEQQKSQGYMAFTVENIENLLKSILQNFSNIKQACIVNAFDILTKFHKDNKCLVDDRVFSGWKTNDAWMVNKKIIVPYGCSQRWDKGYMEIHYTYHERLNDIEKALCFLTGKQFSDIEKNGIYHRANNMKKSVKKTTLLPGNKLHEYTTEETIFPEFHKWHDSEFFEFKGFKKGTLHLKFKDDNLYKKFNIQACIGKNWLPADYGKSTTQRQKENPEKPLKKEKTYKYTSKQNNNTNSQDINSKINKSIDELFEILDELNVS